MPYRTLRACINDLEKQGELVVIREPVDPILEMATLHRRIYAAAGPALYFEQVTGSPFPAVSNLFGTSARTHFLFRDTLATLQKVIALREDPLRLLRKPWTHSAEILTALKAIPRRVRTSIPVTYATTTLSRLPQLVSWPQDGGAFITLPQVFTLPPGERNLMEGNLGMYRIQISGNEFIPDQEAGMHYQIHRGIGVHHTLYSHQDMPFKVSVFVGGPPAASVAAVMPLPEGLSELTFAGMLGGRRFRYAWRDGYVLSADADFCITGTILKDVRKPEGPFGDHLGYYSLQHDFPVLKIDKIYHRKNPVWPFTVVGRPPQEDSSFGQLIHELTAPLIPHEFPGVREINAVDAAGVHPLLLAIGSERYMPFRERRPEEILTQANHLLGQGQTSLAKYLLIAADGDDPELSTRDVLHFLLHVLSRFDPMTDVHFQTHMSMDTLDYSGTGFNAGSKVVIAACGPPRRILTTILPQLTLPSWARDPVLAAPGILAVSAPPFRDTEHTAAAVAEMERFIGSQQLEGLPLILLVDDAPFVASTLHNFLWVAFTRSNPSHDIYGFGAVTTHKHWGCRGPVVIDARIKPHHAPVLAEDPEVLKKTDRFFRSGAVLARWG